MTTRQLIDEFGIDVLPSSLAAVAKAGKFDEQQVVLHAIEPRKDRDPRFKTTRTCPGARFNVLKRLQRQRTSNPQRIWIQDIPQQSLARWGAISNETYSSESPGMIALGDVMQLQHEQKQKGNAIDYMVKPPDRPAHGS